MKFKKAHTDEMISSCQQLLDEVYNQEHGYGLAIPDRYDRTSSLYLFCEYQGKIASTLRVVFPDPIGLPMEEVCRVPAQPESVRYAEISRIAVHPDFRGHILHAHIYAEVCRVGKELGLSHFVAEVDLPLVTLYKRFFCYTALGEAVCDPDMVKKPEDEAKPNVLPMIGGIDDFLNRFISSKFSQTDLLDLALEVSKHKGLSAQKVLETIRSVA